MSRKLMLAGFRQNGEMLKGGLAQENQPSRRRPIQLNELVLYNGGILRDENIPQLSKTRFLGGLQCQKRVYLEAYHRELVPPISESQQALFDSGNAVGVIARDLFPDGCLIEGNHFEHAKAVLKTESLISDQAVTSIYEAAFTFDRIRTRVDILKRMSANTFALAEVKSSTKVKPIHIPDAAIQVYVAEGSGIKISKVYLVHIDNSYVYDGGPYAIEHLFHSEDITSKVRTYLKKTLPSELARMKETLGDEKVPEVSIGNHCNSPYECPFYAHCREGLPGHHIEQLPGVRQELLDILLAIGVEDIADISNGFLGLSQTQRRVRDAVVSGKEYVGQELGSALSGVEYPLMFLDFETFNPALPLYPGTRPYQVIPFQWSMHLLDGQGGMINKSFLHRGSSDPRKAFVESLLEATEPWGSIVVYSSYEDTQLRRLAAEFPEHESALLSICGRMIDLLKIIRASYYHPGFHGSYSLKSVLPVVVPELDYSDLEIKEGSIASLAFAKMIDGNTTAADQELLRNSLLAYCQRDTEAMVKIWQTLSTKS